MTSFLYHYHQIQGIMITISTLAVNGTEEMADNVYVSYEIFKIFSQYLINQSMHQKSHARTTTQWNTTSEK